MTCVRTRPCHAVPPSLLASLIRHRALRLSLTLTCVACGSHGADTAPAPAPTTATAGAAASLRGGTGAGQHGFHVNEDRALTGEMIDRDHPLISQNHLWHLWPSPSGWVLEGAPLDNKYYHVIQFASGPVDDSQTYAQFSADGKGNLLIYGDRTDAPRLIFATGGLPEDKSQGAFLLLGNSGDLAIYEAAEAIHYNGMLDTLLDDYRLWSLAQDKRYIQWDIDYTPTDYRPIACAGKQPCAFPYRDIPDCSTTEGQYGHGYRIAKGDPCSKATTCQPFPIKGNNTYGITKTCQPTEGAASDGAGSGGSETVCTSPADCPNGETCASNGPKMPMSCRPGG